MANATLLAQPAFRFISAKAETFPEGAKAAFQALEAPLESLRGRRFYGLAYPHESGMDYYAGLVPRDSSEEEYFAELGFPVREVAAGTWARMKVHDWNSKLDQLGSLFGVMIDEHGVDPTRPHMEYYRSFTELHLLLAYPLHHPSPSLDHRDGQPALRVQNQKSSPLEYLGNQTLRSASPTSILVFLL